MTKSLLKVITVIGTRPEIIRLSSVLKKLDATESIEHVLVHTGQNYDYELNEVFFQDFGIRKPDYFLNAAGKNATETIGNILINVDPLLEKEQPEYWREEVQQIRADSIHSSSYLAAEALDIIERFVEKQLYNNRTELFQSYSKLVNALVRSKPLMALLYTYGHRILNFIENLPKEERDIRKVKKQVLAEKPSILPPCSTR